MRQQRQRARLADDVVEDGLDQRALEVQARRAGPAARSPLAAPARVIGPTSGWSARSAAASVGYAGAVGVEVGAQHDTHRAPAAAASSAATNGVPLRLVAAQREQLLELVDDSTVPAAAPRALSWASGRV